MDPWIASSNPYHNNNNNHHHHHSHQQQSHQQQQKQYQLHHHHSQQRQDQVASPAEVAAIHHQHHNQPHHHRNPIHSSNSHNNILQDMPAASSCTPGDRLAKMRLTVKRVNENRSSWTVCSTGSTNHHHSDNNSISRNSCGSSSRQQPLPDPKSASIRSSSTSSSHVSCVSDGTTGPTAAAGQSSHYHISPAATSRTQSPPASSLSSSSSSSDESNDSDDDDDKSSDSDSDSSGSCSDSSCSCSCSSSHSSRSSSPCPRSSRSAAANATAAVAKAPAISTTTTAASSSPITVANGKGNRMKDKTTCGAAPAVAVEEIQKLRRYRIPVLRNTELPAAAATATSASSPSPSLVSKCQVTPSAKSSVIPKSCSSKSISRNAACQPANSLNINHNNNNNNSKSCTTSHQLVPAGKERRDAVNPVTTATANNTTTSISNQLTVSMSGSLSCSSSGNQVLRSTGSHCNLSNAGNRLLQPAAVAAAGAAVDVKPLIGTSLKATAASNASASNVASGTSSGCHRNANASPYVTSCNQIQQKQPQPEILLPLPSHQSAAPQPQQHNHRAPLLPKHKRQESQAKHQPQQQQRRQRQSPHNQAPLPQQQLQQQPKSLSKSSPNIPGESTGCHLSALTPIAPVTVMIEDPLLINSPLSSSSSSDMRNMSGEASPASAALAAKSCLPAEERQRLRRFRIDHLKTPRPEQNSTRTDCDYSNQAASPAVPSPASVGASTAITSVSPMQVATVATKSIQPPVAPVVPVAPAVAVVPPVTISIPCVKQVAPVPVPHTKSSGKSVSTTTRTIVQKVAPVAGAVPAVPNLRDPSPRHQSCSPAFVRESHPISPSCQSKVVVAKADARSHGLVETGTSVAVKTAKNSHASKVITNPVKSGRSKRNASVKASAATMTDLVSPIPSPQTPAASNLMSPGLSRYPHSHSQDRSQQMRLILPLSKTTAASTMTELGPASSQTSAAAATMAMMIGSSSSLHQDSVSNNVVYPVPQEIFPAASSSRAGSSSSGSSRSSPDLIPHHVMFGMRKNNNSNSPLSSSLSLSSPSSSCRSATSSRAAAIAGKLLSSMNAASSCGKIRSTPPPPASPQQSVHQSPSSNYHHQQQQQSSSAIVDVNRLIERVTSQVSGLRLETRRSVSSASSSPSFHSRVTCLLSPASAASLLVNDIFKHRDYLMNANKRELQQQQVNHSSSTVKQIPTCKSSPPISSKHQSQYSSGSSSSSSSSCDSSPSHHRKQQQQQQNAPAAPDPLITREMMPGDSVLGSASSAAASVVTDSIYPLPSVNPVEVFVTEETSDFCPQESRGKKKSTPSMSSGSVVTGSGMRKRRINKTGWDRVKKKKNTSSSASSSPAHVMMSKLTSSPQSSTSSSSSSVSRVRKSATMTQQAAAAAGGCCELPHRETRGSVIRADTAAAAESGSGERSASSPSSLSSGGKKKSSIGAAAFAAVAPAAASSSGIMTAAVIVTPAAAAAAEAGRVSAATASASTSTAAAAGKGGEEVVVQGNNSTRISLIMSPDDHPAASSSCCGREQGIMSDDASPVMNDISNPSTKSRKKKVMKGKSRPSASKTSATKASSRKTSTSSTNKNTIKSKSKTISRAAADGDAIPAAPAIPETGNNVPADASITPVAAVAPKAAAPAIPRKKGKKPVTSSVIAKSAAVKIKIKAQKHQQQRHQFKNKQPIVRKKGKSAAATGSNVSNGQQPLISMPVTANSSSSPMDAEYDCDTAPRLVITKPSVNKIVENKVTEKAIGKVRKVRRCSIFKTPVKKYLKSGLLSDDYKIDLPATDASSTTTTASSSCSSSTTSDPVALSDVILPVDSACLPSCPDSLPDVTEADCDAVDANDAVTATTEPKRSLLPLPAYSGKEVMEKFVDFMLPYDVYMFMHAEEERKVSGFNNPVTKTYKKVKSNAFGDVKPASNIEQQPCECKYPQEGGGDGDGDAKRGCGSGCLNRLMCIECDPDVCPCREKCSNQRMQKHDWSPGLERFLTKDRGWGVRTTEPIREGEFIMEYIGEVVSHRLFRDRMATIYKNDPHHYCLNLDSRTVIDGYRIANEGRFVNHSCEPNCEMQKWSCNGYYRVGLFSLRDIEPGEELSYDYNFDNYNSEHQQVCHCGSSKCRGVIGGRKKQSGNNSERRTSTDSVISGTTPPAEPSSSSSSSLPAPPAKRGRKRKSSVIKAAATTVSAIADLVTNHYPVTNDLPNKRFKQDDEKSHLPPPLSSISSTVDEVIESVIKMESDDVVDVKGPAATLCPDLPAAASIASSCCPLLEPKSEPLQQQEQSPLPGSSGSETKCNQSLQSVIDRMTDVKTTINHSPRKRLLKVLAEGVSESKPSSSS